MSLHQIISEWGLRVLDYFFLDIFHEEHGNKILDFPEGGSFFFRSFRGEFGKKFVDAVHRPQFHTHCDLNRNFNENFKKLGAEKAGNRKRPERSGNDRKRPENNGQRSDKTGEEQRRRPEKTGKDKTGRDRKRLEKTGKDRNRHKTR
jgi:hypothetical protein